jgi:dienelactone hydrolase
VKERNSLFRVLTIIASAWTLFAGAIACAQTHTGPPPRPTSATSPFVGPWDLAELRKPVDFTVCGESDGLQKILYRNESLGGRPTRVFAYYGAPKNAPGRVPAMVLVHGGGGTAFPQWVRLWVDRGYAAVAMDLAGHGADGKRLPDGGPEQDDGAKFRDVAKGLRETWSYHAVAAVIRGVSFLGGRPEVDPNRIGITGISWGGYLTCIVAGLDDRLKLAVPVYGCGFLYDDSSWTGILKSLPDRLRQTWIDNFDPSVYLPNCRMPILFVNGTNDQHYRMDCYQRSYRLVGGPRTLCVTVRMPHSHQHGWAPKEIGIFADSILTGGKPLPRFSLVRRRDDRVEASFTAAVPIAKADLNYTLDRGPWPDRKWQTQPADLRDGRIRTTLPEGRPIAYFLTVTDRRGATVSTEHEVIPPTGQ